MDWTQPATLSRRALLASGPAAGAVLAMPALADLPNTPDTPILRLARLHRAIIRAAAEHTTTAKGLDLDEELERLFYRRADRIERELMALPCTGVADFAAKLIVATGCGGCCLSEWETGEIWAEARALTGIGA